MKRARVVAVLAATGLVALTGAACARTQTEKVPAASEPGTALAESSPSGESRKPKNLEAIVTVRMGEMFFADEGGTKGGPFKIPAGKTVGIHIVNSGLEEHEFMAGREVEIMVDGSPHGYKTSLFDGVPVDVFVYPEGKKIEVETEEGIKEVELESGADAWLRVKFPEQSKGEWEFACFLPGHYQAGMKAAVIVE